jgi:hypothetical protein
MHDPVEYIGDLCMNSLASHIHVLGHRYLGVAKLVGTDPR